MNRPLRPPLVPEDLRRRSPLSPLTRAVIAYARDELFGHDRNPERVAKQLWPRDEVTLALVQRAATTAASTTDAQWAGPLATYRVQELLTNLGPLSAGSDLLKRGMTLTFDGAAEMRVPGITVSATYATFVGEGLPIPVHQFPVSAGCTLEPRKFASIVTLTREMIQSSNAEALVRAVLTDAVGIALDVALFGSTAGDATRPPGLLNGVTGLTPTTGGGAGAMWQDLGALAAAVAPLGGADLIYIASPGEWWKLVFAMGAQFPKDRVFASGGVPAKTVIALVLPALASASDPAPRLEASRDAALSMDDSAPVGMPSRSMFQTDSVSIRLTMFVSWGLRAPGAISYVTGVTW
jgi:hypothetical protein